MLATLSQTVRRLQEKPGHDWPCGVVAWIPPWGRPSSARSSSLVGQRYICMFILSVHCQHIALSLYHVIVAHNHRLYARGAGNRKFRTFVSLVIIAAQEKMRGFFLFQPQNALSMHAVLIYNSLTPQESPQSCPKSVAMEHVYHPYVQA